MTADDLERALRALVRRRLFHRFLIEFHSGDRLLVSHPEAVGRRGELFFHRGPTAVTGSSPGRAFPSSSIRQWSPPEARYGSVLMACHFAHGFSKFLPSSGASGYTAES